MIIGLVKDQIISFSVVASRKLKEEKESFSFTLHELQYLAKLYNGRVKRHQYERATPFRRKNKQYIHK